MSSKGNTGNTGWTQELVNDFNSRKVPDQLCDRCQKNKAVHWFGLSSRILCNDPECHKYMQEKFDEDTKYEDYD